MPALKFWFSSGACSLASHVLLYEIRAPFEAVEISVAKGANLTDEFARLNPKQHYQMSA